jgi:hypothetical protein
MASSDRPIPVQELDPTGNPLLREVVREGLDPHGVLDTDAHEPVERGELRLLLRR